MRGRLIQRPYAYWQPRPTVKRCPVPSRPWGDGFLGRSAVAALMQVATAVPWSNPVDGSCRARSGLKPPHCAKAGCLMPPLGGGPQPGFTRDCQAGLGPGCTPTMTTGLAETPHLTARQLTDSGSCKALATRNARRSRRRLRVNGRWVPRRSCLACRTWPRGGWRLVAGGVPERRPRPINLSVPFIFAWHYFGNKIGTDPILFSCVLKKAALSSTAALHHERLNRSASCQPSP